MHYLLSIFFSLTYFFSAHPFHVSVSDINYNQETKSVEITHKVFLDDLEQALRRTSEQKIDIVKSAQSKHLDPLIINYLEDNFSLTIDGNKPNLSFIGSEIQADAIWIYQEAVTINTFSEVSVKNTVLFEMFDDQTNLVHIKNGKKTKSLRLFEKNKRGEVKFK